MIVRSKFTEIIRKGHGSSVDHEVISKSQSYIVYAVKNTWFKRKYFFIYQNDEEQWLLPEPYSADKFEIVDSKLPPEWISRSKGWGPFKVVHTTFPEWANDFDSFYMRLADDDIESRRVMSLKTREYTQLVRG